MTAHEMVHLLGSRARLPGSTQDPSWTDVTRSGALSVAREERILFWFGGFIAVVLVVVALVVVASSQGRLLAGVSLPAVAAEQLTELPAALANRASCAEIGRSDLRSPPEGLWFQRNCIAAPAAPLVAANTSCNRTALDPAEFAEVSPRLYVFRRTLSSPAYLWYSSSESCFDLVSTRVVTAVCADQTVSFSWKASPCSAHGGVLAWVNGR